MQNINDWLIKLGISNVGEIKYNLDPTELIEEAIKNGEGVLAENGALVCSTGKFKGRSPKDRYIVKDTETKDTVWWGDINIPTSNDIFNSLYTKIINYLNNKKLYIRDFYACADIKNKLALRIINTVSWHNLFVHHMFLRIPDSEKNSNFDPEFTIINVPNFHANPKEDGTRSKNFVVINLSKKFVIIGGTSYAGEVKKSVFSILNYILPLKKNILSMHCSANVGVSGDTSIFFGLSGTGKTTLSADNDRKLIGDDEHGWSENSIFNFEGGCYAKTINLTSEGEPQIYNAIKFGSIVENTCFYNNSRNINFADNSNTENTRTAYPLYYVKERIESSIGPPPKNIFFLTCDAYGILPPISLLTTNQSMYHFISGYTSKIAGTETGINEPQATFSACFGVAFLPLNPIIYATMLGKKLKKDKNIKVWLVNTGWTGGPYRVGQRIDLSITRTLIRAALNNDLDNVQYDNNNSFKLNIPQSCPGLINNNILNPQSTWKNKKAYNTENEKLILKFKKNFDKYKKYAPSDIYDGAPIL